ncbi:hypothetical protein [Streptomyces gardneri]|uniref:hypothetical protein n=1 Tax=Streptomyces gardneri TaxID=66892 RepID=UPI0033DFE601
MQLETTGGAFGRPQDDAEMPARRCGRPTVRQVTAWLTRHPAILTEEDRPGLKELLT